MKKYEIVYGDIMDLLEGEKPERTIVEAESEEEAGMILEREFAKYNCCDDFRILRIREKENK